MALRRRLGRAFGGISKTLGMLLQNQLIGQRQQELRDAITKAQQEGQIGSEVGKLSESVAGGTRDPEAAQAQLNAVLDMFGRSPSSRPTIDFGSMQPNVAKRTITAMEPITGATAAQQIPEDQDLLTQQIQRRLLASSLIANWCKLQLNYIRILMLSKGRRRISKNLSQQGVFISKRSTLKRCRVRSCQGFFLQGKFSTSTG